MTPPVRSLTHHGSTWSESGLSDVGIGGSVVVLVGSKWFLGGSINTSRWSRGASRLFKVVQGFFYAGSRYFQEDILAQPWLNYTNFLL